MTRNCYYDEYLSEEEHLMLSQLAESRDHLSDCGPTVYVPDENTPGIYHSFMNPMWENENKPIVTFSDYLYWNETEGYLDLLTQWYQQGRLKIGKRPYTIYCVDRYVFTDVQVHKEIFYKVDDTLLINEIVVIASITAIGEGRHESMSQWYCIRMNRTISGNLRPENIEITIYKKQRNPGYPTMSPYLAAYLTKEEKEREVYGMLAKYYDKAIREPCAVKMRELVDNMGYDIREEFLSSDGSVKGKIIFDAGEIMLYNADRDRMESREFNKKTIFIDPSANRGRYYDTSDDTIAHECIHAYEHPFFMKVQALYREELSCAGIETDLETLLTENAEYHEIKRMEQQAKSMGPRVRMPAATFGDPYMQYFEHNTMRYFIHSRVVQETISDVTHFFGTSKASVKIRMKELGFHGGDGVNVHCNDNYVPRHAWSRRIRWNQSYTIESHILDELIVSNARIRSLMQNEILVYVESHVCLNHDRYITPVYNGGFRMTTSGRADLSKCCLLFDIHREYGSIAYTHGGLNNIDKRGMLHVEVSDEEIEMLLNEANVIDELPDHRRDDFFLMLKRHKEKLGMSERELSEVSTIEPSRLHNIMINNVKKITVREVVAIALGLGMQPEEIFEFVKKSPAKFEDNYTDNLLQTLIRRKYETGFTLEISGGPARNPTLYNAETDEYMQILGDIEEGDIIRITTKTGNKTVTLERGGVQENIINRLVSGSTWLALREGENKFYLRAASGISNLKVRLIHRNAYLGV